MEFKEFNVLVQKQFEKMCLTGKLFRSNVNGDNLWDVYLTSFKPEHDPIFRDPNSSSHNCNTDKNFIRRYGNIVALDSENNIISMFHLDLDKDCEYYESSKSLSKLLSNAPIVNVFFETFDELNVLPYEKTNKKQKVFQLGMSKTYKEYTKEEVEKYGNVELKKVYEFNHFHVFLPENFVDKSGRSVESIMGEYRDGKNVFKRALDEISVDTIELVKDLINQGSLLNGEAHLFKINEILPMFKEYKTLNKNNDNWCWNKSYKLPFAKFRNELIGTLCVELSEGVDLNTACQTWNKRVDPANYMKAKAPITKKQIDEAKKFVSENGYEESFNRRFATLDDINVSEILHSNTEKGEIKNASIFDTVKPSISKRHKRSEFDKIEEVGIEKFMKDILPSCSQIEIFIENRFENNFVALTTTENKECKELFKWNNPFSWTYKGNLAGKSMIKEAVKNAGGKVDGVLRFSISWNDDGRDIVDLDAHAKEPNGLHIYYGSYKGLSTPSTGTLDVDMIRPTKMGVENITWVNKQKMRDGSYRFWVNNYCGGNNKGFKAEIEFEGEIFSYEYNKSLTYKEDVEVAVVKLKNGVFEIEHKLQETTANKTIWNLETNNFHKVNLVCLSPNHWGENNVGNKHYLFMINNCKSDESLRSFHVENLNGDLLTHRKVMEVLGVSNQLQPSEKQLAGLGFNATIKDEVIVRLSGNFKRVIKLKF